MNPQLIKDTIIEAYFEAIDQFPNFITKRMYSCADFSHSNQVLLSIGKNALNFALQLVKNKITFDSILVVQAENYFDKKLLQNIPTNLKLFISTHPHTSKINVENTEKVIQELHKKQPGIIHILVTGGSSSCFVLPEKEISLKMYEDIVNTAFDAGFKIDELNQVRSLLDAVKAGKLLGFLPQWQNFSWIVSDVVSDNPAIVGSGPSVPGIQISSQVLKWIKPFIKKYNLDTNHLLNKLPKTNQRGFVQIIGSRLDLIQLIIKYTYNIGLPIIIGSTSLQKNYLTVRNEILRIIEPISNSIVVFAGEPTVDLTSLQNKGKGGRLSLLLANLAQELKPNEYILGIATDGKDGSSPHGAYFIDYQTKDKLDASLKDENYNIERRGDTGELLSQIGCGVILPFSNINLMDIIFFIKL